MEPSPSYAWDALFRVVSITAPDGGVTTFEYNTEDELVETTDAEGGVTTLALDDLYRPTTVTDANGEDWSRSYDPVGNVLSTTDPLGEVTDLHLRRCRTPDHHDRPARRRIRDRVRRSQPGGAGSRCAR